MKTQRKIIILIKLCRPFEKLQSTMFNLNAVIPTYIKKNRNTQSLNLKIISITFNNLNTQYNV